MFEDKFLMHVVTEFAKLFGELLFLFVVVSFMVALLQIYISPAKVKSLLTADKKVVSGFFGSLLGSVTPFCSCSTIPVLSGLLKSGAPFCGIISFLLTSPVLNPAIITLIIAFFGLKALIVYAAFVLSLSIIMGLALDKLGFESEVKEVAKTECGCAKKAPKFKKLSKTPCGCQKNFSAEKTLSKPQTPCGCQKNFSAEKTLSKPQTPCGCQKNFSEEKTLNKHFENIKRAANNSKELFKNVFPYLLIGAGIGAFIHEVIPTELLSNFAGKDEFWAIPLAAVAGIPMYIRAETMIPVASILMTKGVAPGIAIALIIGGAGASLPELSLLSSMFKKKMLAVFVSCVFIVAVVTGVAFNFIL